MVLKQGSTGPEVKRLQARLKALGFSNATPDGKFGTKTKAAVVAFQKSKGLSADGVAGLKTLAALQITDQPQTGTTTPDATANNSRLLTEADFKTAAQMLNCDVAAIKAVAEVESSGNGFLSDGRVKILFEGHQFYKHCDGAYATSHPTICFPNWTKKYYTKGANADVKGAGELARLEQAIELNRTAALMSASYGKFQIMGFNYDVCGFDDVEDFYEAMQVSEGEQLKAFSRFVIANDIDTALRTHDWKTFARRYNGPKYKENKYDTKLAAAHKKYSNQ